MTVLRLDKNSPCILPRYFDDILEPEVIYVLEIFGAFVLHDIPSYIQRHVAVFGEYIKTPTYKNTLKVLFLSYHSTCDTRTLLSQVSQLTTPHREAFITLINQSEQVLTDEMVKFLRNVPIFESHFLSNDNEMIQFVSCDDVPEATQMKDLPCCLTHRFISVDGVDLERTMRLLGVPLLKQVEVIGQYALDDLRSGALGDEREHLLIECISTHITEFELLQGFLADLSNIPFVHCDSKHEMKKLCPHDLFDPEDKILHDLFNDEDQVFPSSIYMKADMLLFLRTLGLKQRQSVTAADIYSVMTYINEMAHLSKMRAKGTSLLRLFNECPDILQNELQNGQTLYQYAKQVSWVPIKCERCFGFPNSLKWFGVSNVGLPSEVMPLECAPLVGSVCSIIDGELEPSTGSLFSWNCGPSTRLVLAHLQNVVRSFLNAQDKVVYLAHIQVIYRFLQTSGDTTDEIKQNSNWVWHGDGFTAIDSVFEERLPLDLTPFVHVVVSEMQEFLPLLRSAGLETKCTTKRLVKVLQQISHQEKNVAISLDDSHRNLFLALNILDYLKMNMVDVSQEDKDAILVPTEGTNDQQFGMHKIKECTFCDEGWIRSEYSLMDVDAEDTIIMVHPNLSLATAESLGIPTLISRVLHEDDMISGFGQSESLPQRLRNLLQDYSDGLALFKEMIQNADDAGATEVRFMYDERTNDDYCTTLLDDGMRDCQGPALWIYNNQVFSDEDFQNVTKLGGRTKEKDNIKIGRFGLGFNSVYNLTDVPSFISRQYMVIFDPLTKHLGRALRDKSQPGIKIDMNRNKNFLKQMPDQFHTFHDVFDCNSQLTSECSFNGTLFRLPLRTRWQADQAERDGISPKHYTKDDMISLLRKFTNHADNMILFTQHVRKISLYHIPVDGEPAAPNVIFSMERYIREPKLDGDVLDQSKFHIMTDVAKYMNDTAGKTEAPCLSVVMTIQPTMQSNHLGIVMDDADEQLWIVTQCSGTSTSVNMARESHGTLTPVAGIAIRLSSSGDSLEPQLPKWNEKKDDKNGVAFCFLPLPIGTDLPVHINGSFAVEANRKYLNFKSEDDQDNTRARWNEEILRDAVTRAYITSVALLDNLVASSDCDIDFFKIWPTPSTKHPFNFVHQSFYDNLDVLLNLPLCWKEGHTVTLSNVLFFDPEAMCIEIESYALHTFQANRPNHVVIKAPATIRTSLLESGHEHFFNDKMFSVARFYEEILFPNIKNIENDARYNLLIFALKNSHIEVLGKLLSAFACIPVTPSGVGLTRITHLIHPQCDAADLYTDCDERFPHGEFAEAEVLELLVKHGMEKDIQWLEVKERAMSVQKIFIEDEHQGKERQRKVLKYIEHKLQIDKCTVQLDDVEFLQVDVSHPPPEFQNGDREIKSNQLFCAKDLYPSKLKALVSASKLIIDDTNMEQNVQICMGLHERQVSMVHIIKQFQYVLRLETEDLLEHREMLYSLYDFLNSRIDEIPADLRQVLQTTPSILLGESLVMPEYVAFETSTEFQPYLHKCDLSIKRRHKNILKYIGVQDKFVSKDLVGALKRMHTDTNGHVLSAELLDVSLRLLEKLGAEELGVTEAIYIPDRNSILELGTSLCYDEQPWLDDVKAGIAHSLLAKLTCKKLGVKTMIDTVLAGHAEGVPFGQYEELTNSLRRICQDHPIQQMLKELIQNADDAGATEINFICDNTIHKDGRVFANSWKSLQGPALCIYNNGPFTADDLVGIQKLGMGSKRGDPAKTGQYGVGFSSVYHLTDVPSILTYTEETKKTLCVLDPHCKYVPGATTTRPGMKYEDIEKIESKFPDVFSCYMHDLYDVTRGCMIRLPLRSVDMARCSHISLDNEEVTMESVMHLLKTLEDDGIELLLFTKSIEKIVVSRVDQQTGEVQTIYQVEMKLSEEQRDERNKFTHMIKQQGQLLKDRTVPLSRMFQSTMQQVVHFQDTKGLDEAWVISQVIGFPTDTQLPAEVLEAFKTGNLALLPVGGCAISLDNDVSSCKERKAYCFLPLPENTGLPVHINGHFALGTGNRGHVWDIPNYSTCNIFKYEWNKVLCSSVIAVAYVHLLKIWKNKIFHTEETMTEQLYQSMECLSTMQTYFSICPDLSSSKNIWHDLVADIYRCLHAQGTQYLPLVSRNDDGYNYLTWLSTKDNILFCENEHEWMKPILLECDSLIVESTSNIHGGLSIAKIECCFITPMAVRKVLKLFGKCLANTTPLLTDSPFKNVLDLVRVVNYSVSDLQDGDQQLKTQILGLPMLTMDGHVRTYSDTDPVYAPYYDNLVPSSAHRFVHVEYLKDCSSKLQTLFKKITLTDLVDMLSSRLPVDVFINNNEIKWTAGSHAAKHIDADWLFTFWQFVAENDQSLASQCFATNLANWCLIPATIGDHKYLFPISRASSVAFGGGQLPYVCSQVLRRFDVPWLYTRIPSNGLCGVLMQIVKVIDQPADVMHIMKTRSVNAKQPVNSVKHDLSDTPFNDLITLMHVLTFCVHDADVLEYINGLPMLLTQDGYLRQFDSSDPVYEPHYCHLLTKRPDKFVNPELFKIMKGAINTCNVFKEMKLRDLANMIQYQISIDEFANLNQKPIEWTAQSTRSSLHMDEEWFKNFWRFAEDQGDIVKTMDVLTKHMTNWCLLPATIGGKRYLFPIGHGKLVAQEGLNAPDDVHQILKEFGIPWFDLQSFYSKASGYASYKIPSKLVKSIEKPADVLKFMTKNIKPDMSINLNMKPHNLNDTPYITTTRLQSFLQYCARDPDLANKLHGLPILLTKDGYLKFFNSSNVIFEPRYASLLPNNSSRFVEDVVFDVIQPVTRTFNKLEFDTFAEMLPENLSPSIFKTGQEVKCNSSNKIDAMWLVSFWQFVAEVVHNRNKEDMTERDILKLYFSEWCLIPARIGELKYMFPIGKCNEVAADHSDTPTTIHRILKRFKVPWLNVDAFCQYFGYQEHVTPLEQIVVQVCNRDTVILFLRKHSKSLGDGIMLRSQHDLLNTPYVDMKTFKHVLDYCLNTNDMLQLEGLPFALTKDDRLRNFANDNIIYPPTYADLATDHAGCFLDEEVWNKISDSASRYQSWIQTLTLTDLARMIPKEFSMMLHHPTPVTLINVSSSNRLNKLWNFVDAEVQDQDELHRSLGTWLNKFWNFVEEEVQDQDELLRIVGTWCLLQANAKGQRVLFPLNRARDIFYSSPGHDHAIIRIFTQCNVPMLQMPLTCTMVHSLVTTLEEPNHVLEMLDLVFRKQQIRLSANDAEIIMIYFAKQLSTFHQYSFELLRTLPLHKNMLGNLVQFSTNAVYTICEDVPTAGMDIFSNSAFMFLKVTEQTKTIYRHLECVHITVDRFYCDFVFQHVEFLGDDIYQHMHFVYNNYMKVKQDQLGDILVSHIKDVAFLKDSTGELKQPCMFYSPNKVFSIMRPGETVTQSRHPFTNREWHHFLSMVGLHCTVTKQMFLQFAKEIAASGNDHHAVEKKSRVLVEYLFKEMDDISRDNVLPKLSRIPFVVQGNPSVQLRNICAQYVTDHPMRLISFWGSIGRKHENLIWTRIPMLPSWADPEIRCAGTNMNMDNIIQALEIETNPKIEMVSRNLVTVGGHCAQTAPGHHPFKPFKDMYEWMAQQQLSEEERNNLKQEPIVAVLDKNGDVENMITPARMVIQLSNDEEIRPHLCKIPNAIGQFKEFFQCVGCSVSVCLNQYIQVLTDIKHIAESGKLSPNNLRYVYKAMAGMFRILNKMTNISTTATVLYLPDEKGCMCNSKKLVFNDSDSFYNRLPNKSGYVANVGEAGMTTSYVVRNLKRLPGCLIPKILSECVIEELVDEQQIDLGVHQKLCDIIKSSEFCVMMVRLLCHEAIGNHEAVDTDEMQKLVERLSVTSMSSVKMVRTCLTYNNKVIKESESDKICFVKKIQGHRADLFEWQIFIRSDCIMGPKLFVPLSDIIDHILDCRMGKTTMYMHLLFECTPNEMKGVLDYHNIVDEFKSSSIRLLPILGSPVYEPKTTLTNTFSDIETGQYVGYCYSMSEVDMIHGLVKDRMASGKYLIDIGLDTLEAAKEQLFKFKQ